MQDIKRHLELRILHFKLEELRNDQVRVMFRIDDEELQSATMAAMSRTTFSLKTGAGPPDYLEREAQRFLGGNPREGF